MHPFPKAAVISSSAAAAVATVLLWFQVPIASLAVLFVAAALVILAYAKLRKWDVYPSRPPGWKDMHPIPDGAIFSLFHSAFCAALWSWFEILPASLPLTYVATALAFFAHAKLTFWEPYDGT